MEKSQEGYRKCETPPPVFPQHMRMGTAKMRQYKKNGQVGEQRRDNMEINKTSTEKIISFLVQRFR